MAKHEFGIMQHTPQQGERYDEYEPEKYGCICVEDDYVEKIDADLTAIDFYWHTTDRPAKGIAYTGITLIPPSSMPEVMAVVGNVDGLKELNELLKKALAENKWVIHFGL